ncbi:MAG: SH3 domain-containing protein [Anaerolineae bacterium]|jgi:hypothetical protein|nr:SH3 domain-containing protein [Anaerolineae bacterium]
MKRFLLVTLLVVLLSSTAHAALRNGLVFGMNCSGFVSRGGELIFNRDNTGTGREQYTIQATDGNGVVIFTTTEVLYVGSRLVLTPGLFFEWNSPPTANPITVRVTSNAGNGLSEQAVYTVTGLCAGLPNIDIDLDPLTLTGETSPSVAINAVPPRPVNPPLDLADLDYGYLIVNTASLNIRSGDSVSYTIVGRVSGGTELIVLGSNLGQTWWYVQVGEIVGWVNNVHVLIRGDLSDVPVVPVTGEIARATLYLYRTQALLALPIEGALPVCEIAGDQEYVLVGRNRATTWYELEALCNGVIVRGWVPAENGGLRNPAELILPITD